MIRKLYALALLAARGGLSGCSMCCSPFDYDYAAYGGVRQRADMQYGRVGSRFEPADGYPADGYYVEGDSVVAPGEGEWEEIPPPEPQQAR